MYGPKVRPALVSVLLGLLCLCWSAAPAVAGTPAPGFQIVTGSDGSYQYQVPASWRSAPQALGSLSFGTPQGSTSATGVSGHIDTAFGSSDGNQFAEAAVLAITGPTPPTDRLLVAARGSLLSIAVVSEANGGSSMNIFEPPHLIEMPTADGAVTGTGDFTDPDGVTRVVSVTWAQVGKTLYYYAVMATADFYQTPTFATIVNSFQITPAAQSGSSQVPSSVG
jgi:hypothetical protein